MHNKDKALVEAKGTNQEDIRKWVTELLAQVGKQLWVKQQAAKMNGPLAVWQEVKSKV